MIAFNIRSAKHKEENIKALSRQAHVVGLCETWHKQDDQYFKSQVNEELIGPKAGELNRNTGGVALIVHPLLRYEVQAQHSSKHAQYISIRIGDTLISIIYLSPSGRDEEVIKLLDEISRSHRRKSVIMGDFNARHKEWDHASNMRGRRLVAWASRNGWVISGSGGATCYTNRGESSPDLFLTRKCVARNTRCKRGWWEGNSDHVPIAATIKALPVIQKGEKIIPRKLRSASPILNTAREMFAKELPKCRNEIEKVETREQLEKAYEKLKVALLSPWESVRKVVPARYKPQWSGSLDRMAKQRTNAYKQAKRSNQESDWKTYRELDKRIKRGARREKLRQREKMDRVASNSTDIDAISRAVNVTRAMKGKGGRRKQVDLDLPLYTSYMTTAQEKRWAPLPESFKVTKEFESSIERAIDRAKNRKAEGVDGVFVDAFKIARKEVGMILGLLWQKCSDTGYMIRDWRTTMLVPLYKKGDSKQPASYRPIALMSHGRKIIDAAIALEVRKEYKFHPSQLGFRPKTGTETAIIRHIAQGGHMPITAILDLKGAYDNIPRDKLMKVLEQKLQRTTRAMIKMALGPSVIQTKGDESKKKGVVCRGVPQGSPSSPTIFNVYMDTLARTMEERMSPNGRTEGRVHKRQAGVLSWAITMFADDVKLQANNRETMQQLLDIASQWAVNREMIWAPQKCFVITARPTAYEAEQLTLAGSKIQEVTEETYLGVSINTRGTTDRKTLERVRKASNLARCIRHEGVNVRAMSTKALRNVVDMLVMSTATYGLHLCPKSKEVEKEWDKLELEIGSMAMGIRTEKKAPTVRTILRLPSLSELKRMRMAGLSKRIEERGKKSERELGTENDIKALRVAKKKLKAAPDMTRQEWLVGVRRSCDNRRRRIPFNGGRGLPPVFDSRNETVIARSARWYCGTFPPNPDKMKRHVREDVRDAYAGVSQIFGQERLKDREATKLREWLEILGGVDNNRWCRGG